MTKDHRAIPVEGFIDAQQWRQDMTPWRQSYDSLAKGERQPPYCCPRAATALAQAGGRVKRPLPGKAAIARCLTRRIGPPIRRHSRKTAKINGLSFKIPGRDGSSLIINVFQV